MVDDIKTFWQDVFRQKFERVILRRNYSIPIDEDMVFYNVFMLPDDAHGAYAEFYMNELWKIAQKHGVDVPHFLPVFAEDTRKYHPEIAHESELEFQDRKAARPLAKFALNVTPELQPIG